MTDRLIVDTGETYTVSGSDTEEWFGVDVDGTLEVNGTLELIDNPDTPSQDEEPPEPFSVPLDLGLETGLDLPVRPLNLRAMETGLSIFLIGLLSVLLGAAYFLKNYAAGGLWGFSIVALLLSGLFGIGLELFWAMVIATILLLILGMAIRVMFE